MKTYIRRKSILIVFLFLISVTLFSVSLKKIEKLGRECGRGKKNSCIKLTKIAKNNKSANIRAYAIQWIQDPDVLGEIAVMDNNYRVRVSAVKKISDQKLLFKIIKNEKYDDVRLAAMENLKDHKLLKEVSNLDFRNSYLRKAAKAFVDGICRSSWPWVNFRGHTLCQGLERGQNPPGNYNIKVYFRKYKNQQVIGNKVKTTYEVSTKAVPLQVNLKPENCYDLKWFDGKANLNIAECIPKVSWEWDINYLITIASNGKERNWRILAIKDSRLTDQKIIKSIALHDVDEYIRHAAVKKINDSDALAKIIKTDRSDYVRKEALRNPNLKDQILLADIFKNSKDERVRKAVIENPEFHNPVLLTEIAKTDSSKWVRFEAITKLSQLNDQEALADIAQNITWWAIRRKAVEKLEDQKVLSDIVKNDEDLYVRKAAVKKLQDQKLLADIAKNDKVWYIRLAAVKNLEDQKLLADIAKNDEESYVREAAESKIRRIKRRIK